MSTDTVKVTVTHRFTASAERVFDAWLDPKTVGKWLFATPTGTIAKAEIDARVGGTYSIVRRENDEDIAHTGTYLEIIRPKRLVFTFGVPTYSSAVSTVTIDITPLPSGCELTLTNEGILSEWADKTKEGWGMILDSLERSLS